jgi:hypothetical protein
VHLASKSDRSHLSENFGLKFFLSEVVALFEVGVLFDVATIGTLGEMGRR